MFSVDQVLKGVKQGFNLNLIFECGIHEMYFDWVTLGPVNELKSGMNFRNVYLALV